MKGLIRDILTFLRELQENNDREWFAGQKPRYQKLKEGFDELVDRLIAQTAVWDEEVKNLKAILSTKTVKLTLVTRMEKLFFKLSRYKV
mgnify:FL=1